MTISSGLPLVGRDVPRQDLGEEVAHRVEVARDARGLRHVPAVAVEDRGGVVEQLAHDGRPAGAPHRDVHLGGGGGQRVVDDLELDRRDAGMLASRLAHGCTLSAIRWPLLVAPAGPAVGEQHGGVGLLDHGRSLQRQRRARSGRGSTRRSRASAPPIQTLRCRAGLRSLCTGARPCPPASAAGRWPTRAATRSRPASRGWRRRSAGGGCRGSRRSARRARPRRVARLRRRHGQLEGLALVAHVGGELDAAVRGRHGIAVEPRLRLLAAGCRPCAASVGEIVGRRPRAPWSARGRAPGWSAGCRRPTACWRSPGTPRGGCRARRPPRWHAGPPRRRTRSWRSRADRAPSRTATGGWRRRGWRW